ncbi:unnamed protein product, partial [Cladocopium goreaui]
SGMLGVELAKGKASFIADTGPGFFTRATMRALPLVAGSADLAAPAAPAAPILICPPEVFYPLPNSDRTSPLEEIIKYRTESSVAIHHWLRTWAESEGFEKRARMMLPRACPMPDIAKSDISPNLDRDKMFNELWWLNYCFCEGVGIGAVGNPFCGGEAVNICLHSRCEMTDVGDPFCSNIRVCLCITDQCALPPSEGSPICVCFNKKLAGGDGWSGKQLFDWSTNFGDTFWLYYIFCMGLGFSAPQANGRPLFAVETKELCIKGGTKLTMPMEGGKLCSMVSTRLCFWEQCALPPAEGAPMFVCFNLLNPKGSSAKPLAYGMTVHRGLLSFLASSRKKFEEDLAALLPSRDADGQEEIDQMEPLQNKDDVQEEEAEMPQAEELEEAEIGEVAQAEVEDEQERLPEDESGDEQIVDAQSDKAEMPQAEELEAEIGEAAQMTDDKSGDKAEAQDVDPDNMSPTIQQQFGAPLKAVRPLEAPCSVAELSPLAEPLEEPLEEEDSELEAEEVGDVKMHLARRRKRLEAQLFATGRRRSKADGWPKQEMKAEPMPLKKEKREATFVKRELDRGTSADGQQSSPARSLLKRRRRGPGEEDGICESESPAKQGRVMRGLPRSDLLRMAGNLERRYLCSDSLAVTA